VSHELSRSQDINASPLGSASDHAHLTIQLDELSLMSWA